MKSILSVSGFFSSTFGDEDPLADKVHSGLYKTMYEGIDEKLKANLNYQKTIYAERAGLNTENAELKAKVAELEAKLIAATEETTMVGEKRARTDTNELLDRMQQMLAATVVDQQLQELRTDKAQLQERLKGLERLADTTIARLAVDNERKTQKHEKLRSTNRKSAATMGAGTRLWARFIELDLSVGAAVLPAVAKLQESLKRSIRSVHAQDYLRLVPALLAFNQRSLDAWVQRNNGE